MQKILSGSARGRPLKSLPDHLGIRPILSRIKKSVFDILRPRMAGCRFLDLYAGTGSVGLEALSEGARSCTFVEKRTDCLRLLNQNLEKLGFVDQSEVFRLDALGNLSSLGETFDIIFMGPPYVDDLKNALALTVSTIINIDRHHLLKPVGILVAQHHKKEPMSELPSELQIRRSEKYGDTIVDFIGYQP